MSNVATIYRVGSGGLNEFSVRILPIYPGFAEPRLNSQRLRVALNVIHQPGNLLFGEQVEREVACQVGESESNARICQGACALASGGYVAGQCRLRDFARDPFCSPHSPKFECRYRAEMEEFVGAERRPGKGTKRDRFGGIAKRSRDFVQPGFTTGGKWIHDTKGARLTLTALARFQSSLSHHRGV